LVLDFEAKSITSSLSIRDPRKGKGLRCLKRLLPPLDQLDDVGCQREKAGNRGLHFDQYCLVVLLFLFKTGGYRYAVSQRVCQASQGLAALQRFT
jgi:hypothetical protein